MIGTVVNSVTGDPVNEAIVDITAPEEFSGLTQVTDANGQFTFSDLDVTASAELSISVRKSGYVGKVFSVPVSPNLQQVEIDNPITLEPENTDTGDGTVVTGESAGAAAIIFESISQTALNIRETGGIVNAAFTFIVQDSSGRAVDLDNSVDVIFDIVGPGGGEEVLPKVVKTNASGKVTSNIFSGDSAGVVQIIAKAYRSAIGDTIYSRPVALAIHGGFPVESGFSLYSDVQNVETSPEESIQIYAKLVDQSSNPVKEGTAVYFETDLGSIQGSSQTHTDDMGEVNVELFCDGNTGPGTVTATTLDRNGQNISKQLDFVCSTSKAVINATPLAFDISDGGSETFTFTVTDLNGNPMAAGTSVSIKTATSVELSGSFDFSLGDNVSPGPGATEFNFTVRDLGISSQELIIAITVTSPSGEATTFDQITGNTTNDGVAGPSTGAASIILEAVTEEVLNVSETGGVVNSAFTFSVQDSAGRNLDLNNQTEVTFSILAGPDGGEGITPVTAMTNASGKVTTNLFSGTKAGVVQVQAEIVRDDIGLTIRSRPVAITIHGGFPDEDHFSIAPEDYNFEGYTINGLPNELTVILGDKFSNPVKPGTAVYFSTTGGIIEGSGSGNTDENGFVSVNLISGDPRPDDSQTINGTIFPRPGLATLTAQTVNEDNQIIEKSTNVIFSTSQAIITANPTTFDLQPGGGATFTYKVTDLNGNPMAAGTQITVEAGDGMEITGDNSVNLGNYIFPGSGATDFTFSIRDIDEESDAAAALSISITVTAPSGTETTSSPITGTRRKVIKN